MSRKEIGRMEVIRRVVSKRLRRKEAACQATRAWHSPDQALGAPLPGARRRRPVHAWTGRHRGKRPGNATTSALREEILRLVRTRYGDFGDFRPTPAAEKLYEPPRVYRRLGSTDPLTSPLSTIPGNDTATSQCKTARQLKRGHYSFGLTERSRFPEQSIGTVVWHNRALILIQGLSIQCPVATRR